MSYYYLVQIHGTIKNISQLSRKPASFFQSVLWWEPSAEATAALANFGLLDERPHTSNGPGFLEMVAPSYKGQSHYLDEPSVVGDNLITASSTGGLLWARQIIEHLEVFESYYTGCVV